MIKAILTYDHSVIFMMDNEIGGYSHPEHVVIGKTVEGLCKLYRDPVGFSVSKIYQAVLPDHLNKKSMKHPCFVYRNKHEYNKQTWRFHVTIKNGIIHT